MVWGGVRVQFGAAETNSSIYLAYYDSERWLAVSKIDKCSGQVEKVRLASQFEGWDAHNSVVLAMDNSGRLHVAGNMHVSPLIYARMNKPDDFKSMSVIRPMVGLEEERTTYPNFFRFPDGALGFSYRYGHSGNGKEIINQFDGERWIRWGNQPLFAPVNEKQPVNAYHTGFISGSDGFFHTAWVWREQGGVEKNFHVNYAKSQDLKNWQNSKGKSIALPLTLANAELVDSVTKGRGLLNNIKLGFDADGRVVISYLKFDSRGFSQLFHARIEGQGWKAVPSTNWTYRWDPRGGGTIPSEISFSGVEVRAGQLLERVRQPEIGNVTLKYAPRALHVDSVLKNYAWEQAPKIMRKKAPGSVLNIQAIPNSDAEDSSSFAISWLSHPPDNRDKRRKCKPTGLDCQFVSELYLHKTDL
jgi:BNR repeat-containing family member